ncbi:hypothetical protein QL093DRAFT_2452770 [Fusarium oxysporum]|nr:hypothetical protein QL093DRAFT_2452770 [Fusarium oxysporum]
MPANPTPKVPCSWTRQWIKSAKTNPMWIIKIYPSVAELGSEEHPTDEQLQLVKEMGMIFSYLNHKDIWPKYCAVYEAIYDHMGDFDTWYSTQQEWKEYNRLVLDSMVRSARYTEIWMYNNKE